MSDLASLTAAVSSSTFTPELSPDTSATPSPSATAGSSPSKLALGLGFGLGLGLGLPLLFLLYLLFGRRKVHRRYSRHRPSEGNGQITQRTARPRSPSYGDLETVREKSMSATTIPATPVPVTPVQQKPVMKERKYSASIPDLPMVNRDDNDDDHPLPPTPPTMYEMPGRELAHELPVQPDMPGYPGTSQTGPHVHELPASPWFFEMPATRSIYSKFSRHSSRRQSKLLTRRSSREVMDGEIPELDDNVRK